jgi:peptide deformylase
MALPNIVRAGHPVLRQPARRIAPEELGTKPLRQLVETLVAVMRKAPGVGLAAPQIGVGLALVVLEDREELMSKLSAEQRELRGRRPFPLTVIVNPELSVVREEKATFLEGCLSVPGYMGLVERALTVEVRGIDLDGKPLVLRESGWPARILQHELDHLAGTLYVDRMLTRSFAANEEVGARWMHEPPEAMKRALGA